MTVFFNRILFSVTIITSLSLPQQSFAVSFDLSKLTEAQILRIIDEEVLKKSDPESMEWTENAGIQPKDTYELDYFEKCNFIRDTRNKKALAACAAILE
ncbi:MAG: hypothetical protein ACXVCP_02555 [Bdellovibrio sp.]